MTTRAPRRIHIIDDSKDMQKLLTLFLEAKGYQVDCSLNGEDAMVLLNSDEPMPDVILLDSLMPTMSGFEFLQARRELPRIKKVPVIMMSGETGHERSFESLIAETCATLTKPFRLSTFIDVVERQFEDLNH